MVRPDPVELWFAAHGGTWRHLVRGAIVRSEIAEATMSDMKVNNLNVDLIQNSAAISLVKYHQPAPDTPASPTIVSINLPMGTPGDELESALRKKAINQARDALVEAIKVLEAHAA